jgi:predicted small integral membrane protein
MQAIEILRVSTGEGSMPEAYRSGVARYALAVRCVKIALVASLAFFVLVVTFNNLTDYGSNFAFVSHVLSMDTTFPGNALMYRAISAPIAWHAAYWLIILAEALTGALLAAGAIALWRARLADATRFNAAKLLTVLGCGLGFLLWFTGFMAVGGEWFAMWQSSTWNGQEAAFRIYVTLVGVLIFVNQRDPDIG